jgi:hypothetical protein
MEDYFPLFVDNLEVSMSHSFGPNFWKTENATIWKQVRQDVVECLDLTVASPTPLAIFQACHSLLTAPARFLKHIGFSRPMAPAKPKSTTNTSAVLASEAIKRGQSSKALRILTGTGAAPHTPEQLVRTAAMFPEPRKRVTFVQSEAKLTLNPSFLYKKFAKLVTADEPESSDVYGWDPVLFRDPEAADSFIPAVCSFLEAFIGWGFAPTICSQLLAAGSLVSIYKLPEVQRENLPEHSKHGIRPIGGECLFGKMMDRHAQDSDEAKSYKSSVRPVQRAFDSRGVTSIPLAALGALKKGFAAAKGDFKNAFNELCRQAALENLHDEQPALANFYSRALLSDIPMITRSAAGQIEVIWCRTGVPQGSVTGTPVFTAGVKKIFDMLRFEFPTFFLAAATDDLNLFLKPEFDTVDLWQDLFRLFAKFLRRYESLAWEYCSLRQNISKGAIILPHGAPFPSEEVMTLFPEGFKFHHVSSIVPAGVAFPDRTDGFVICGAPVGSDFYIDAFTEWKTDIAISKLHAIDLLSHNERIPTPKHVAFKLLASCGIKLMSYVATVVPPQFSMTHLKRFDNEVKSVFFKLLYPGQDCTGERFARSYHRATLSVGQGGLGLLRASVSAAALWWANLRALQADSSIYPFLGGLDCYVQEAIEIISENVGGKDSTAWMDLAPHLLPPEVYDEAPDPPPKTLLRVLLIEHSKFQNLLVKDKFDVKKVQSSPGGGLTKSDVIAFNTRSNLSIVFNSKRLKNMSNDQFVKLTTVFLGLPPTHDRGNADSVPGFDYPVESCMTLHGKNTTPHLDANGDHHSGSCPSAGLAVNRRHNNLTTVLSKFAMEAGAMTSREPSSYKLLQGCLSKVQCDKIFPKSVPAAYKKTANEILSLLAQSPVDQAKVDALYDGLPQLDPALSAALRVDLSITNPSNGKVYLIDGSFIHTSCTAYRDAEFKSVEKRLEKAETVSKKKAMDPSLWDDSVSIAAKVKAKVDKYAPLMQIILKFQRESTLEGLHFFVPFVVSSLGELSKEAYGFREELVSMFNLKVANDPRAAFPLAPAKAVAEYRARLTAALMQVAAVGLANITCTAGKPFRNHPILIAGR